MQKSTIFMINPIGILSRELILSRIKAKTAKSYIAFWPSFLFFALVLLSLVIFLLLFSWPKTVWGLGILLLRGEIGQVVSPRDAIVERWLVEEGDQVQAGEKVLLIRPHAHPLTTEQVVAPAAGYIAEILSYPGTSVSTGEGLALLTALGDKTKDLEVVGFVSSLSGKLLKPGMKALVYPSIADPKNTGALLATVKKVGKLPTSKAALKSLVKIPELAKYLRSRIEDEPFLVILSLTHDQQDHTGYRWSGAGPSYELDYGLIADFSIIYDQPTMLERLWPSLHHLLEKRP
jgi:Biotin-requiring enzyme